VNVRSDEKRLDSAFSAGSLTFDQVNYGEMTYVLDLSDERICPICGFDLDQRVATGGTIRFSFDDLPMKASRPREGSQGFSKISVSRIARGVRMENAARAQKIALFVIMNKLVS
jgi:hypothetical protein